MVKEPVARVPCVQGVDVLRDQCRRILREPRKDGIRIDVLIEAIAILRRNGMTDMRERRLGRMFLPVSEAHICTEYEQHGQYSGTAAAQVSHDRGSFHHLLYCISHTP